MLLQSNVAFKILDVYKIKREERHGQTGARHWAAIAFRLSGESRFESLGKIYEAKAGSTIYIPEGVAFSRKGSDEELVIIHLKIYGEAHEEIEIFSTSSPSITANEFITLYDEWSSKRIGYQHRCSAILSGILAHLSSLDNSGSPYKLKLIESGEALIEHGFTDPDITVTRLAEICSVSPEYFRAIYKSAHGITPHKRIDDLRITRAKRLLETGDFSIAEVAERCGFRNTKYFTALFTKRVGACPRDYKRKYNL